MTGITLTTEQIRNAPAGMQQWIEQEVVNSLGLSPRAPASVSPQAAHLVACCVEGVAGVLEHIRGVLPAVNVLLEIQAVALMRFHIAYREPAYPLMRALRHQRHHDLPCHRWTASIAFYFRLSPSQPRATLKR